MIRQSHLIAVVGAFLIAGVVVGCGSGPGYIDERDGERGADATNEETTAPKGDRSAAGTAQEELVGFDEEVASPPGQGNEPRDFGEGSLWATGFAPGGGMAAPPKPLLKRVDPQTGEVVANIDVQGAPLDIAVDESSGAVWVANNRLTRVDPETNRVAARIPIPADSMSDGVDGVAVGEGAVWVSSGGKLLKVDLETNEVAGMVSVDAYYSQLVFYGGGVWAMGQGANEYWLVRVDPPTMHVVAAQDIGPYTMAPGLVAGGG